MTGAGDVIAHVSGHANGYLYGFVTGYASDHVGCFVRFLDLHMVVGFVSSVAQSTYCCA